LRTPIKKIFLVDKTLAAIYPRYR
jgi:hypothetical protein